MDSPNCSVPFCSALLSIFFVQETAEDYSRACFSLAPHTLQPQVSLKMATAAARQDPYDLARFLTAQEQIYPEALAEVKRGQKESHWMWFIFPQIDGLGRSPASRFYAIKSKEEARAYLEHPVLGKRLIECCAALLSVKGKSASEIFGYPDDLKLHSSMSLFASISAPGSVFSQVLRHYFEGKLDQETVHLLERCSGRNS